jgi:hypothetical protein
LQCRRRVCGPQSLGLELARGPCGCACPGPVPATAIFSPKTQSTPPAIPERNPTRCAPFSLPPHPRLSPASALTLAASLSSRRSTTTPAPACRLPPAACACCRVAPACRACACRALTTTTRPPRAFLASPRHHSLPHAHDACCPALVRLVRLTTSQPRRSTPRRCLLPAPLRACMELRRPRPVVAR